MLEEHKEIVAALKNLIEAAKKEKKMEYARFADKLMLHAQNEEEVLYPATCGSVINFAETSMM